MWLLEREVIVQVQGASSDTTTVGQKSVFVSQDNDDGAFYIFKSRNC